MSTTIPGVTTAVADGALSIASPDTSGTFALIGTSTSGTANQVYSFAGSATAQVKTTFGDGTLVDWGINHLLSSEGRETLMVRGSGATAGSNGTVTQSGSGPLPTLTGTATEDAELRVLIVVGGTVGTATYRLSLDGGRTYQPTKTTAASVAIGNGVTVVFTAGTYVAAELYSAALTGPRNSVANIGTAIDALYAQQLGFGGVHILGHAADAADTATLIAAVEAKMADGPALAKFPFAIIEAPPVDPALLVTALASIEAPNVVLCGGFAQVYDDSDKTIEKVSIARAVAARLARNPISVAAARSATDSDLQSLAGVRAIYPTGATGTDGYLDSFFLPALNNARCTTLMTHPGRTGFYVANAFTLSAIGSDYLELENRRIINRAREVLYTGALKHLQRRLRRDATTGFISEGTAIEIDRDLETQLNSALVAEGHATKVRVVTNRADNLASDPTLRILARIVAVSRARTIEVTVGLAVAL